MAVALQFSRSQSRGRPAVVAAPHPLYGGRMDNRVVTTVADALSECGYAPLRFNWRGVGSSECRPSDSLDDAREDYRVAIDEALRAYGSANVPVLAAGYSFGALAALGVAESDDASIERLVLVAPPVRMLDAVDLASIEKPIHVIVGQSDQYATVEQLAAALSVARAARLDVIPDADHFLDFRHGSTSSPSSSARG